MYSPYLELKQLIRYRNEQGHAYQTTYVPKLRLRRGLEKVPGKAWTSAFVYRSSFEKTRIRQENRHSQIRLLRR